MKLRVSRYAVNSTGYTFAEWCEMAGVKGHGGYCRELSSVGPKEREAWRNDEDPGDWFQANRQIEEANRLGSEADLNKSPEPPWRGKDLFTLRRRRAFMEGFHQVLYSRTRDGEGYVGPGVRPCLNKSCGDGRCHRLQREINEQIVAEVMER